MITGHVETIGMDASYLVDKMMGEHTPLVFMSPTKDTRKSEKVFLKYYKDLDSHLIAEIDKAFRVDYLLFGYKNLTTLLQEEKQANAEVL